MQGFNIPWKAGFCSWALHTARQWYENWAFPLQNQGFIRPKFDKWSGEQLSFLQEQMKSNILFHMKQAKDEHTAVDFHVLPNNY